MNEIKPTQTKTYLHCLVRESFFLLLKILFVETAGPINEAVPTFRNSLTRVCEGQRKTI